MSDDVDIIIIRSNFEIAPAGPVPPVKYFPYPERSRPQDKAEGPLIGPVSRVRGNLDVNASLHADINLMNNIQSTGLFSYDFFLSGIPRFAACIKWPLTYFPAYVIFAA
jgi:hypothetical protein